MLILGKFRFQLKDDLEKYEHLQELARAILCWRHGAPSAILPGARSAETAAMKDELVADFGIAPPRVSVILFVTLILSGFLTPCCRAALYHSGGSAADVQAAINQAKDGDTITLPAGTLSWTSTLNIAKGITLQGQT